MMSPYQFWRFKDLCLQIHLLLLRQKPQQQRQQVWTQRQALSRCFSRSVFLSSFSTSSLSDLRRKRKRKQSSSVTIFRSVTKLRLSAASSASSSARPTGGDRSKIRVKLWAISENNTVHDASEETVKESFKPKKEKKDKEAEKAEKSDKAE